MTTNPEPRWRYTGGLAMTMTPVPAIEQVVEDFEPFGIDFLHALDQCVDESYRFVKACEERGVAAEMVAGFTYADPEETVILQGHTVARVGDTVYDWTARQFDEAAPLPLVQTYEEFREKWKPLPGYGDAELRSEAIDAGGDE